MWTVLPLNGILRPGEPGGTFSARWSFYRPAVGAPIEVEGERLDADAPPLAVDLDLAAYTGSAEVVGVLTFPTAGCWRVTATSAGSVLTFVVLVSERR